MVIESLYIRRKKPNTLSKTYRFERPGEISVRNR